MSHFQVMIVLQKRVRGLVGLAAVLAAALAAKAGVTPGAVDIGLLKKARNLV